MPGRRADRRRYQMFSVYGLYLPDGPLRADPVAGKDYQDEFALLEGGSMDGLVDEDPHYTTEEVGEIGNRRT